MSLFKPRENYKPYEYPSLLKYRDAIRESYWLHKEFSYDGDVHDYRCADDRVKSLVERSLLAISQVEIAVKQFWGRLYEYLPKPEILEVGMTFAESEVRHANAYAHLIDLLGLNDKFEEIIKTPAFKQRADQLRLAPAALFSSKGKQDVIRAIALFSVVVENVSLFSQFYVLMALNKRLGKFRGISNAVAATSKEEHIHAEFGFELVRLLKAELGLSSDTLKSLLLPDVWDSRVVENELIDWIFEGGDIPGIITSDEVKRYVEYRYSVSSGKLGVESVFRVEQGYKPPTWFDAELVADKEVDFFAIKPVSYSRNRVSYEPSLLF